ncbi:hypothetical protein ABF79_17815 [Enterobacter hormaechei subsp. steigerwaltii]|nr:hypothetical protein ABF79_17815 [Enterobacter hormaechei subsp. steigerwaltii]KLR36274.1 hypothetical protein ABF57_04880 [Enterobacter hormaechei subsp. steigerwaltii]
MQQMEENSPRVVALQYCLKQVAEKVEEAEKRNAELEARCAALSAENSGLKSAIDATIGWQQSTDPENVESVRMLVDVKTPVTDAFLAEVRASAFNDLCAEFVKHKALAGLGDRQKVTVFEATEALLHCAEQLDTQFRKGVQS